MPRGEALERLRALNQGLIDNLGHADWRLPTLAELERRLAQEKAASTALAEGNEEVLAAAVASLQAARGELAALVPARGAFIPPGFPDVVVFATNSIHLEQSSVVVSGDVVANDASPGPVLSSDSELTVGIGVSTPVGATLRADTIKVKLNAQVASDVAYNELDNNGTITGTLTTPLALPVFALPPPFKTGTPGSQDVVVLQNQTGTLPAGDYRLLDVKQGGTVFFTGGVYNFEEIYTGSGVSLLFDGASDVKLAGRFATSEDSSVGPSPSSGLLASDVVFFVAGINGSNGNLGATPKAAKLGLRNQVQANFYVPNGTLWLRQGTHATGAFLGRDVDVGLSVQVALQSAFFNRAPLAVDDSASGARGGTISLLDSGAASVLANDSDPNGDALGVTTTPVSGPVHGTLTLNADGTFSYAHDGSLSSSDAFTYEVCDQGFPVLCGQATVFITIDIPPYTVTVQKAGSGTGTVMSSPSGIDCGATCSGTFASFLAVTLAATPDPGSQFTGFGGDPDCADGVVSGPDDVTCTATFDVFVPVTLTVEKNGTGGGYVGSDPAGIDCGPTCSAVFPQSTRVGLGAVADAGSIFVGWSGDPDCADGEVVMDAAKTCLATFDAFTPPPPVDVTLSVQKLGAGGGTVSSDPAGIDCGATCSAVFPQFSRVALSAAADAGSVFVGFGGDADCEDGLVALDASKSCTATFDLEPVPPASSRLTVVLSGSGTGTVTSNPAGIVCGETCEALFPDGSTVTLFARPEEGVFVGWGGDCTGASFSTSVTIGPDKTCTATFETP